MENNEPVTVIVPVLDEHESLAQLALELAVVAAENSLPMEILFVDDGSSDGSWETIRQLAASDARIRGIRFSCRFGKDAALAAGLEAACGPVVIQLDADLQDVPAEIPRFLQKLREGYDIVVGWRSDRHERRHRILSVRVRNWLITRMTGLLLHDHDCSFRCFRTQLIRRFELQARTYRFLPAFIHARGCKVAEIPIRRRPRRWGHSKCKRSSIGNTLLDVLHLAFPRRIVHPVDRYTVLERIPEKESGI
jgi:glycosyltransferase involved in cell wall biosynthesis